MLVLLFIVLLRAGAGPRPAPSARRMAAAVAPSSGRRRDGSQRAERPRDKSEGLFCRSRARIFSPGRRRRAGHVSHKRPALPRPRTSIIRAAAWGD